MSSRWRGIAEIVGQIVRRAVRAGARPAGQSRGGAGSPVGYTAPAGSAAPTGKARRISYAPKLDGRADPGEIVWSWVAYEDDPSQGKDRPVLVVARKGSTLLGLMLSSQSDRDGTPHWHALGVGDWDRESRPSWVRLDRVLELPDSGIRREGAILDKSRFEKVARQLRSSYGWS